MIELIIGALAGTYIAKSPECKPIRDIAYAVASAASGMAQAGKAAVEAHNKSVADKAAAEAASKEVAKP